MKVLYFDCFSGAGGDMLVGALLDAGAPFAVLEEGLAGLRVPGFKVRAERIRKQGFSATQFFVDAAPEGHLHRGLAEITSILTASSLPEKVRRTALAAFDRLARAEAEAHGIPLEQVHFHEVGAIDAIVDVVACALAVNALAVDHIVGSPLAVGGGTVKCAHGIMPVPAPATALLLKGVPLQESNERMELLTPTAAALLTTLCASFGPLPELTLSAVGMGAGTRDTAGYPNVVRALVGDSPSEKASDVVTVLEANLDDTSGEAIGHCLRCLREAGALDAWCVPIQMKKDRPGVVLTVLCAPSERVAMEEVIFRESTTFGVRYHDARRSILQREQLPVDTPFGRIRVKVGRRGMAVVQVAGEYEDCSQAARQHGVPLREVMEAARAAWWQQDRSQAHQRDDDA